MISDAELNTSADSKNGTESTATDSPKLVTSKSLFGNSASRLRESDLEQIAQENETSAKALDESQENISLARDDEKLNQSLPPENIAQHSENGNHTLEISQIAEDEQLSPAAEVAAEPEEDVEQTSPNEPSEPKEAIETAVDDDAEETNSESAFEQDAKAEEDSSTAVRSTETVTGNANETNSGPSLADELAGLEQPEEEEQISEEASAEPPTEGVDMQSTQENTGTEATDDATEPEDSIVTDEEALVTTATSFDEKDVDPEAEEVAPKSPAKRRGRSSVTSTPVSSQKSTVEEENLNTSTRSRRSTQVTPKKTVTPSPRGRRSVKQPTPVIAEEEEKEEAEEAIASPQDEDKVEDEAPKEAVSSVSRTSSRRSKAAAETPAEVSTPTRSLRGRASTSATPAAKTPKTKTPAAETQSRKRGGKANESTQSVEAVTPKSRGRRSGAAEKVEEPVEREEDPFDFEEMGDTHPEPLKNIQVEVKSFGEARYSKVGAGKYSNTEKAASGRVGIVESPPEKPAVRRSLMELTQREADLAAQATRSAPTKRSKRVVEEEDEGMDFSEETPKSTFKATPIKKQTSERKRAAAAEASSTPKKAKFQFPELTEEEQIAADLPDDAEPGVAPGSRVFALYDKVFYPAIVIGRGLGTFQVKFVEDKLDKELPEASIIPIALLTPGTFAVVDDNDLALRCEVVALPRKADWGKGLVSLRSASEEDNKEFEVRWDSLLLNLDDWKDYVRNKDAHATDIKQTNIESSNARVSRSRNSLGVAPATPAAPKTPSTAKKSKTPASKSAKTTPAAKVTPVAEPKSRSAKKEKPTNTNFFTGYSFLLTSANRPLAANQVPFKKNELKNLIIERGGTIIEAVTNNVGPKAFLISDTYYRTQKYLAALANDMPCVSHEWVLKCVEEESFVDYKDFGLQAGLSIVDEDVHPCTKLKGRLLKGKTLCIFAKAANVSQTFESIWTPIAEVLGAKLVKSEVALEKGVDYFITDASCPQKVVDSIKAKDGQILSSEWLIQSIIMGSLPEPTAHDRFSYDFNGSQA